MTRLILYNIEYLEGTDGKKFSYLEFWKRLFHPRGIDSKIVHALKKYNPDIVALIEVGGENFIEGNYFIKMKKELGMKYHIKRVKYDLKRDLSLLKSVPILNKQSNAIMSKRKLYNGRVFYLKEGIKRGVIEVEANCGKKVTLLLVHLALARNTRAKQIKELIKVVKKIKTPIILAGDFNTFKGEKEIKKLLVESGLKHNFKSEGERVFTYPSYHPKRRLDYVLTSPEIKVKQYRILKVPYSDHLPVMIDFEIKRKK